MKPQTLFLNTIFIAIVAAAVLAGLGGTDLGHPESDSTGDGSEGPDSTAQTESSPRPPQIADPLPTGKNPIGKKEGNSNSSQPVETSAQPAGEDSDTHDTAEALTLDESGGSSAGSSPSGGQGARKQVRDARKQVSENLRETLGETDRGQQGSLSVEAYNQKADSLRQAQQENLENVIGGS